MINDGGWALSSHRSQTRRFSRDSDHLKVLLAIAAVLLALALGLDDQAVSWVLGRDPAHISAHEEHHLEEVRYMLALDEALRSRPASR
jgi:hypothetical protein